MANADPHQKFSTSRPPSKAEGATATGDAGPDADCLGPLVQREAVDEDAQRCRMTVRHRGP